MIATAKHFFGDGGTAGVDQGNTRGDLAALKAIHAAPYPPAIAAGVQSVMASFSSVNGEKLHGSHALLTGVLRGEMRFSGLTVGDWNGHGQVPGCTNTDCPKALLAGLDVYMAPEEWRGLYDRLVAQVNDGTIPMARLDEAVARLLRVKLAYGVFDKPRPSARRLGGKFDVLGREAHRAVAREAVRKSLVLLKNDGALPLRSSATVLVAGPGADSVPMQSGGWSITWQGGGDLTNADFPGATSIYAGIASALKSGGGRAILARDGVTGERPDAAVVVFGEEPYAEFSGDRKDLAFRDEQSLALMRRLRSQGVPVTAVFLSGRPLWVNRFLAEADAFVAAWLPGSEGGGVADVLVGDSAGRSRADFSGRLPFSWPARCDADAGNGSDGAALFRRGQGFSYAAPTSRTTFNTDCQLLDAEQREQLLFGKGRTRDLILTARDERGEAVLPNGLEADRLMPSDLRVIATARTPQDEDSFRAHVLAALREHVPVGSFEAATAARFAERLRYVALDARDADGFAQLAGTVGNEPGGIVIVCRRRASRRRVSRFVLWRRPTLASTLPAGRRTPGPDLDSALSAPRAPPRRRCARAPTPSRSACAARGPHEISHFVRSIVADHDYWRSKRALLEQALDALVEQEKSS